MHLNPGGQERFHALIAQSPFDRFFVTRFGMQGVPAQFFLGKKWARPGARFVALIGTAAHSFALWVPLKWVRLDRVANRENTSGEKPTSTTGEERYDHLQEHASGRTS